MRAKISQKSVATLQPNTVIWDAQVRGLCARRQFSEIDLQYAKAEIERPLHSLKDGETRAVERIDRSGRPVIEFFNKTNSPSFWMEQFKGDVVQMVSGGSAGIATEDRSGQYRFDKGHLPEYRAAAAQLEYMQSTEFQIISAYIKAGVAPPSPAELAVMVGRR